MAESVGSGGNARCARYAAVLSFDLPFFACFSQGAGVTGVSNPCIRPRISDFGAFQNVLTAQAQNPTQP